MFIEVVHLDTCSVSDEELVAIINTDFIMNVYPAPEDSRYAYIGMSNGEEYLAKASYASLKAQIMRTNYA